MNVTSKQVLLASRPNGLPKITDFKIIDTLLPELKEGDVLLKTQYFSLDPYMRSRMNSTQGSYIPSFKLNEVMDGAAVCVVEQSKNAEFKVGDVVLSDTGWQTYAICRAKKIEGMPSSIQSLTKLSDEVKSSFYLGALGMPGITAHHGLLSIGQPKPGETVVVSAATGPVGSMVGQIAKAKGCRVVGIAGGSEKCQYAVNELGFDACVDYKQKSFANNLKIACPTGIDIYYENVGGAVFQAVSPLLNNFARVPVCGLISFYNDGATLQEPGIKLDNTFPKLKAFFNLFVHFDQTPLIFFNMLAKRIKYQGFIISDHFDEYPAFLAETIPLVKSGKIKVKEDIVKGIENSPAGFIKLLQGKNFGKLVVEV